LAVILLFATSTLRAERKPVMAEHGVVVSANALASQAGAEVLLKGGNAVDAAVATGFALAVTYPQAGNIGGGGFMVLRLADGRTTAIDFRETAPARAQRDLFLDASGKVVPGRSTQGYLASGIPGTVAGLALAHERYGSGKLTWSALVEPARRLAEQGFPVTQALAGSLRRSEPQLSASADSKRIFLKEGKCFAAGEAFRQPDLAATFARLQLHGPREFYEGETARLIAQDQTAHGGLITREDLARYRVVERPALRGTYRGYEILTMPPPSSGGVALLQILGMLEPRNVGALRPDSAEKIHLFAEAMRRAFRDRAEFMGDPDFVKVPVAGLLDRAYLARRFSDFDPSQASPSEGLAAGTPASPESMETTHYSVVDAAGNAVAVTYTLNGLYGSGVTATGTGVLLNNEMDDFTSKVGVKNMFGLIQGEANAIAPGKRPLSSMTPTIVTRDGKLFLVTGSPGGPTIITTTLLVITNVIDHGMSLTAAVDAPRFHHQWQPDTISIEPNVAPVTELEKLSAKGHLLGGKKLYVQDPSSQARRQGDAESILIDPASGLRLGATDPRSADSGAAGY
jgi:gamma-glutamyltranspeptidase/glutathione hydrolase